MTTQALLALIVVALVLLAACAELADRYARSHRNPHDVVPVVSVASARHVLALVARLERTDADDAAAARHLTAVEVWAGPERSHGTRWHRRAATELHAAAGAGLVALHLPDGVALSPIGARVGRLHMTTGGRPEELVEVVECTDAAGTIGDVLAAMPNRGRPA